MRNLKQSAAANVMVFMTDSADHVTGKSGLTLAITISKDGADFSAITPNALDKGSGWYSLALTTVHTGTLGDLALHVTAATADPTDVLCRVVGYDPATAWLTAAAQPGDAMTLTLAYDAAKTAAQAGDPMTLPTEYDAAKTAAQAGNEMALTPATITAVTDPVVEGALTMLQVHRILLARQAGKTEGAGTGTLIFKSQDGTKARITYTINPATGERSYVVLDVT